MRHCLAATTLLAVTATMPAQNQGLSLANGTTAYVDVPYAPSLVPSAPRPDPTTRRTRFENCDLRGTRWQGRDISGAAFIRCKLDGIEGRPSAANHVVIEDPDLSVDGDGSDISIADDVLVRWFPERAGTD